MTQVTFRNVPAFAVHLDAVVEVPELGSVPVDVGWGGMFYVLAEAAPLGLALTPDEGRSIVRIGEMIKAAARAQLPVRHPENPEIEGVTIAQLWGPPTHPEASRKNAVVVSTGELDWQRPETWTGAIDRSPCGTGTSAKLAALHARGELGVGDEFVNESVIGTRFVGRIVEETEVGGLPAVVPEITGRAWITGMGQYVLDPEDPFPAGFAL